MNEKVTFTLYLKDMMTQGAKRAAASLSLFEKSGRKASAATDMFGRQSGKAASGMDQIAQGAEKAQGSTESFLGSMLKFEALKAGARAIVGFGSSMLESASFTDLMTNAFDQLTHGHGAETLQHTRRMAEELGLAVHDTTKSYKTFLALQFTPASADKLLAIGADMQALGANAEEVQGIFTALGQIKSKGRIQAQEMLQLAERGVSQDLIYQHLQKNRGISVDQEGRNKIMGLQEQGKVSADEFFVAFEQAINQKLGQSHVGESAKKFAENTLPGMINVFKAQATNMWDALAAGSALDGLKSTVKSLGKELQQFLMSEEGAESIRGVTSAVQGLFTAASKSVPWIFKGFKAAVQVFEWAGDHAIPLASAALVLFAPALLSAGAAGFFAAAGWLAAAAPLLLLAGLVGTLAYLWEKIDWSGIGENFSYAANELLEGIKNLASSAVQAMSNIWEDIKYAAKDVGAWALSVGESIVNGIVQGIKNMAGTAVEVMGGLVNRVLGRTDKDLDINSPSGAMEWRGEMSGAGYAQGLLSGMKPANDVVPGFVDGMSSAEMTPDMNRFSSPDFSGLASGGFGGGFYLELHVNVTATSSEPAEIADETADAIEERLEDMFERWADESAA